MDVRNSLFWFAPHELSHSAFWAWVLESLNTSDEQFEDVRQLGQALLSEAGAPTPEAKITVRTEYNLPGEAGRIDIHAVIDGRTALLIENKVSARPNVGQLRSYEAASELEEAFYLLLSTKYPTQEVGDIEAEEAWTYVNTTTLLGLLNEVEVTHPIVLHYKAWLHDLNESRKRNEEDALSSNPERRARAMRTVPGQWAFLRDVTDELPADGWQKSDKNAAGGGVYTEYWFIHGEGDRDNVFFRTEILSGTPMFRVEQYQQPPRPDWKAKKSRLDELRRLWSESVKEAGDLAWDQKNTGAKYRCEISRLPLTEVGTAELKQELNRVFPVFSEKLEQHGWTVS